ncbi:HEAT repeat domain-containing protein [Spirochaeta lutea]|uniref:HEAT repeat domain-containing protein n=1 Tax=Spirochaeta lutea TaxID=1480694 RepID=A0A098QT83_9SPIO|nr:hypothetical protein [Spirochaeta lutea]KGE71085.1 hypothetical protein DC28_13040 [Spirochaeta lutea]
MIRKKSLAFLLAVLLCLGIQGFSQEEAPGDTTQQTPSSPEELQLNAYLEGFDQVNSDGKIQILQTAQDDPVEQVFPLYTKALEFVISNGETLGQDTQLQRIASIVVSRLEEAGNAQVAPRLWTLYTLSSNTSLGLSILDALSSFESVSQEVVLRMVSRLQTMVNTRIGGTEIDLQLASALVQTLSALGSDAAGDILVQVITARLEGDISTRAFQGLAQMETDLVELFSRAFARAADESKQDIYDVFMDSEIPTQDQKTRFAGFVLSNVLGVQTSNQGLRATREFLRQQAVRVLAANPIPEITPELINHFNTSIVAFDRGYGNKSVVLEAIAALGKTGQPAAANRLTAFLELINTYTEQDRPYDRQIVLAVIENLKNLGRVEAYNALFMVTILNYPSTVKAAAREAIRAVTR